MLIPKRAKREDMSFGRGQKAERQFERADQLWTQGRERAAFRLMRRAAEGGSRDARVSLGVLFAKGIGTAPNPTRASFWYRKAGPHKFSPAAHNLGLLYMAQGRLRLALHWFQKAAEIGDDESRYFAARIYLAEGQKARALSELRKLMAADSITDYGRARAVRLLKQLTKRNPEKRDSGERRRPSP